MQPIVVEAAFSCSQVFGQDTALARSSVAPVAPPEFLPMTHLEVKVRDFSFLPEKLRPKDSMGIDVREAVPQENRVVIGFEGNQHVLMVVGNVRYDGRIFHDPIVTEFAGAIPMARGLYVVLENISSSYFNQLKRAVLEPSNEVFFGCGHAVLSKLQVIGITPALGEGILYGPSEVYNIIIGQGFTTAVGTPQRQQLYQTTENSPDIFMDRYRRFDAKVLADFKRKFRGMDPDALVESINGRPRTISGDLRKYLINL